MWAEANYRKYLENLEQARINQALQNEKISSINVIQPASFVEKPVSPNKLIVIALGLLLALAGPVCLAPDRRVLQPYVYNTNPGGAPTRFAGSRFRSRNRQGIT